MSEIRLAMDLDGVLFDFNTHFINLSREMFPNNTCPDAGYHFPDEWHYMLKHVTKEQNRKLWNHIVMRSEDFWHTCPVYDHSAELLLTAESLADRIYYLTSRCGKDVQWQTKGALERVAQGYLPMGGVIPVNTPEQKIPIINALHCTHFVDDKPETIVAAWDQCLNTKIAVWDQPWNRRFDAPVVVTRLKSVEDFEQWLK